MRPFITKLTNHIKIFSAWKTLNKTTKHLEKFTSVIWRATYIHEFLVTKKKRGGILHL
jgi:hypothetical protein